MLLDVLWQQDVIGVEVPIIFLWGSRVDDPVVVHHEFVVDLLIGAGKVDLFLPDFANFVELLALAPIVEGTGDVHILRIRMWPSDSLVSDL